MIAVKGFNDCLKKQISMNNNHFSTLEYCLKYFSRSNEIMKYNRVKDLKLNGVPKVKKKQVLEQNKNC
jgi:hypothetical protein